MLSFKQFLESNISSFLYTNYGHFKGATLWSWDPKTEKLDSRIDNGGTYHHNEWSKEENRRSWKGRFDPIKKIITVVAPMFSKGNINIPEKLRNDLVKKFPGNKLLGLENVKV